MPIASRPTVEFERPVDYPDEIAARPDRVRFLVVAERRYLMIDGSGKPGEPAFRDAFAALYPVAYTLHFALKRRGVRAPVGAFEGLYWVETALSGPARFNLPPAEDAAWAWRLMLPVPAEATTCDIEASIDEVHAKKAPPLLDRLRFESQAEEFAAQIMHVGPYDAEAPTIERLQAAIPDAGLRPCGGHHEIYISDPNRTAPARLKTLLRQAVEAVDQ